MRTVSFGHRAPTQSSKKKPIVDARTARPACAAKNGRKRGEAPRGWAAPRPPEGSLDNARILSGGEEKRGVSRRGRLWAVERRRQIVRAGLCAAVPLVLGVATSIALAWGPARYLRAGTQRPSILVLDENGWGSGRLWDSTFVRECSYVVPDPVRLAEAESYSKGGSPVAAEVVKRWKRQGEGLVASPAWCQLDRIYSMLARTPGKKEKIVSIVEAGWPLRCFRGAACNDATIRGGGPTMRASLIGRKDDSAGMFGVPIGPIWLGLAADTAIFASAWWLILFAPRRLRRTLRRRRGHCMTCGYDRAGLAPDALCPECGRTPAALVGPGR